MRILVLGSGGREHALAWKLAQSPGVSVFAAPGNPGIAKLGTCLQVPHGTSFLEIAESIGADLTVVGPEAPLVDGIVDQFRARGLKIVGPDREAAQLEGSKIFAKNFFIQSKIPTAEFVTAENQTDARQALDRRLSTPPESRNGRAPGAHPSGFRRSRTPPWVFYFV